MRHFQLAALANLRTDDAETAWFRVVNDMYKAGEPLDAETKHNLYSKYYFALNGPDQLQRMLIAVPPAEQIPLLRLLLQAGDLESSQQSVLTRVMGKIQKH